MNEQLDPRYRDGHGERAEHAPTELEANIENRIVKYVESIGGLALKLVVASERGFPDRTLLLPGGLVVFVEIKRPGKSKTYFMQTRWQERLQRRGFRCEFIRSIDQLKSLLRENQPCKK